MSELARFQDAFSAALAGDDTALAPWVETARSAGLSVYRNTVAKGVVDALAANFPTVERLVGQAWFRAAAREFAVAHPPSEPALVGYGVSFPAWLAAFPPAASMPFLGAAALADRFWTEAHLAADAEAADPATLAALGAGDLARTRSVLHPSVRLAWFGDNSGSLWRANRPPAAAPESFELTDEPEGLLIFRPGAVVESRRLDAASFAFVSACRDGTSLQEAALAALTADAAADLAAIVAAVIEDGLIVSLQSAGEG